MSCVETRHVLLSVLERRSGVVFLFCPRLSVDSLTCFKTRATLSVYLKAHSPANAAVLSSRNGLESIPCSRKSLFTEGERNTREVSESVSRQTSVETE